MLRRGFLGLISFFVLASCSHHSMQDTQTPQNRISLSLLHGWYNGDPVLYITTDVSDRDMAKAMGANYAPRLRDAIPHYPKPPQVKTILERVYTFPHGEQAGGVFASVPSPSGYLSEDKHYSPIWLVYQVNWKEAAKAHPLTSQEAILEAEDQGLITIERTNVVVNCPIVSFKP